MRLTTLGFGVTRMVSDHITAIVVTKEIHTNLRCTIPIRNPGHLLRHHKRSVFTQLNGQIEIAEPGAQERQVLVQCSARNIYCVPGISGHREASGQPLRRQSRGEKRCFAPQTESSSPGRSISSRPTTAGGSACTRLTSAGESISALLDEHCANCFDELFSSVAKLTSAGCFARLNNAGSLHNHCRRYRRHTARI